VKEFAMRQLPQSCLSAQARPGAAVPLRADAAFHLERYRDRLLALHDHICPRQILGLRMGELAGALLGLDLPQADKRVVAFVETDGCFADGVMVATGCAIGHRTMRVVDAGKTAVTFADSLCDPVRAVRVWPHPLARSRAAGYAADARSRWHAQLAAYQVMPADQLLCARPVELRLSLAALISQPGVRALCAACGEEIINQREVARDGKTLCQACADGAYYAYALELPAPACAAPLPQAAGRHHE
jgi:formylmethanofuran dehydrogenase subunit E